MHMPSLNNTSFIYVLVKVLTLIAFSQWIRSWTRLICRLKKKKKIFMPIKHHFGKNEWLKIITETTQSFCHMCTGKLIFLTSTAIVARSDCAPVHKNENMIISLTRKQSTIKKYYLMIDWMIKNKTHLKSFPESNRCFEYENSSF